MRLKFFLSEKINHNEKQEQVNEYLNYEYIVWIGFIWFKSPLKTCCPGVERFFKNFPHSPQELLLKNKL